MKSKLVICALLMSVSTASFADGYRNHGRGYNNGWNWVAPALIGGAVVYGITQAQRQPVYVQPDQYQQPVYIQQEPIYERRIIMDQQCMCQREVLVRVR